MAQRSTLCDRIIAPRFVHKSTQRSADRPEDKGGRRAAVVGAGTFLPRRSMIICAVLAVVLLALLDAASRESA